MMRSMSLHTFPAGLYVLPLVLLAVYHIFNHFKSLRIQSDQEVAIGRTTPPSQTALSMRSGASESKSYPSLIASNRWSSRTLSS